MDMNLVRKYAEFAVRSGANVQKGQTLVITAPIEGAFFARLCAEAAYGAGAREVVVHYEDEQLGRIKMQHTETEVLEDVKPWLLARYLEYEKGGMCVLRIAARNPEIYKGLDTAKIDRVSRANSIAMQPFMEMTMGNRIQWCVVAMPSEAWAGVVFPQLPVADAVEKLWETIFKVCRVEGGDPVGEWKKHVADMQANRDWLQGLGLSAVRLQSANGTDLTIGLADNHVWGGASEPTTTGITFLPNIPTEEVFTAPHRDRVDGVVKSSLPYVYNGNLIEGITARFEKGRVVAATAEKGGDLLQQLLGADEGAKHLGEIALVPASSPIRQSGVLFYNTLFDENAACHIAFGQGYPGTVEGGEEMSKEQLAEKGVNDSLIHEDVMVGTEDMDVTGITTDGREIPIFRGGEWAKRADV